MSVLNTNKLTWLGNDGDPLKNGYVYVGQPGLDPLVEANRKEVTFTDSLGNTAVAPQPMRTDSNGRIQWNGVAIQASVDGDYSLLLLDSNQVQIKGGWSPTVIGDSGSSADFSGYRPYGFTLADIKLVDVSVGDSIGNIGKETLTDGLGADWIAVSNTGGTADDVDLIDFSNGLQGLKIVRAEDVTGFTHSSVYYVANDIPDTNNEFELSEELDLLVFESIGPTGSDSDNEWSNLDALPLSATYLDLLIEIRSAGGTSPSDNTNLVLRSYGSSNTYGKVAQAQGEDERIYTTVRIKIDSNNRFEARWGKGNSTTNYISLKLIGFGV